MAARRSRPNERAEAAGAPPKLAVHRRSAGCPTDRAAAVLTSLLATNDAAGARALLAEHGGVLPADRREGFAARTG